MQMSYLRCSSSRSSGTRAVAQGEFRNWFHAGMSFSFLLPVPPPPLRPCVHVRPSSLRDLHSGF